MSPTMIDRIIDAVRGELQPIEDRLSALEKRAASQDPVALGESLANTVGKVMQERLRPLRARLDALERRE